MTTPAADVSVRRARFDDVAAVARVQVDAWRVGYHTLLPKQILDALTLEDVAQTWNAALQTPPSPYHHLLVAVDEGRVVGLAATGLSEDADLPLAGEILALLVHPNWPRKGHGSRLLAACIDTFRDERRNDAIAWAFEADETLQHFLEGAGFGFDGTTRTLAVGDEELQQVRLRATL